VSRIPLPRNHAARAGLAVLVVIVAVNLIAALVDALAPSPSGADSSSFATKSGGLAAWAELAKRNGVRVRALRDSPADASLTSGTVAVMDGRLTGADARALRRFAERGGRVVAGGEPGPWTATLLGAHDPPQWEDSGPETASPTGAAPETAGVARVKTSGDGRWKEQGVLGSLLLVRTAGRGRIALLADTSPLQNRLLGQADNAAFALALGGRGPLTFVESIHGYGPQRGLAAIPPRFGWALIGLLLAALVFMAARGRRLGPPERERRELAPPRRAYVDSLAATMARGKDRQQAVAPVREEARRRLARRAGIREDAPLEAWLEAARGAGLDNDAARALSGWAKDDDAVVATGRALAALAAPDTRRTDAGAP
jgi:Domain of unknown function (DUF4350)